MFLHKHLAGVVSAKKTIAHSDHIRLTLARYSCCRWHVTPRFVRKSGRQGDSVSTRRRERWRAQAIL